MISNLNSLLVKVRMMFENFVVFNEKLVQYFERIYELEIILPPSPPLLTGRKKRKLHCILRLWYISNIMFCFFINWKFFCPPPFHFLPEGKKRKLHFYLVIVMFFDFCALRHGRQCVPGNGGSRPGWWKRHDCWWELMDIVNLKY